MNVAQKGNAVLAMDVARDDQELLVVTENGYGKRTPISDYPVKGRGTMGVKTIQLTENKGALAGALVVREHQELVFISQNGMVQRTSVRGINRYGRASQGVRVMNIRDDDQVSAVALVVESEAETAAPVIDDSVAPPEPESPAAPDSDSDDRVRLGRAPARAARSRDPVPHRVRLRSCATLARVRPSGAGRGRDARPALRRMTQSGGVTSRWGPRPPSRSRSVSPCLAKRAAPQRPRGCGTAGPMVPSEERQKRRQSSITS